MAQSAEEIRRLLDDPHVTKETKARLLGNLLQANGFNVDEIKEYERKLGIQANVGLGDIMGYDDGDAETAKREHDLGQSWSNLNDSTPSPNSDAILDDGIVGLRIFDEFFPRYTKAGGDAGGVRPGQDVGTGALDPDSLRAGVDELRGIDFTAFTADATAMEAVVKGVDDSRNHLATAWANNLAGWTGGAAQAASQYKAKFDGAVATLDEWIKPIPGAITTASSTIQTQVTDYAKHLHNQWGDGKMAGMTTGEVDAMLEARDKLPGAIQEMDNAIRELENRNFLERALDFAFSFALGPILGRLVSLGMNFAEEITKDNIREERAKYAQALQSARDKLQQFVQDYATKANGVHDYSQQAMQAVQESYDALFKATSKLQADPFAALGATPDFENADHKGTGKGKGKDNGHGRDTTPSNHTGGSDTPGSSTPSPGTSTPPPGSTSPQATTPPVTDPGTPEPTDPGTGTGAGTTKPVGQPETVEIKDGDRTISVTSPDGQGHVKVTVDDGSGKPKTYDLDFGAPTAQPGPDQPHTLPSTNMPVIDPATGQPITDPAGQPAVDPVTGQPVGGTPVQAGADGKCVIQDGSLTITAEHPPGSPDTVKVTIDDGSGKPTTYTLDYSEPGNPKTNTMVDSYPGPAHPTPLDIPGPKQGLGIPPTEGLGPVVPEYEFIPPPVAAGQEAMPLIADPAQVTAAQGSASAGSDYSASGYGGSAIGGPAGSGSFGAPDAGFDGGQHASGSGEAGLAAAADSSDPTSGHQQGQLGAAGSGMPMMGGGMGAGGGGGGDQDRAIGQWRTVGDLFDDDVPDAEASLGRVTSDERGYRR